jgi:hypothetical protein
VSCNRKIKELRLNDLLLMVGDFRQPNRGIGYVGGINTDLEYSRGTAQMFSAMAGGHEVDHIYNPTNGFFNDVNRCICTFRSFWMTPEVRPKRWTAKTGGIRLFDPLLIFQKRQEVCSRRP